MRPPSPGRRARAAFLAAGLIAGVGEARAGGPRDYSLSVEATYGAEPSRASYLREIEHAVEAWVARTGPLGAPTGKGEADLHLQLVLHRIQLKTDYARSSPEADILFDSSRTAASSARFSVLFDFELVLQDPRTDRILLQKELTVFNEQRFTEVVRDPKQRAWDVSLDFLIDRTANLLSRRAKKIRAHLRETDRAAPVPSD